MAAKIGGDDDAPIVDINVTPLVDIVLVLLIIFMVTASLINQPAIKVDLPEAANPDDNPSSSLGLVLTRDNELYLNGNRSSFDELRSFVPQELKRVKDLQAIIQADRACTHGQVIELIDTIKGLGVTKFALNIEQVNMGGAALPPLGGTAPNPANPPPPVAN